MKKKLANLINVKSIVTLLLTVTFVYLAIIGKINAEQFMTVFGVVIAFYFGTQYEKKNAAVAAVPDLAETMSIPAECPYKDANDVPVCENAEEVLA